MTTKEKKVKTGTEKYQVEEKRWQEIQKGKTEARWKRMEEPLYPSSCTK